MDGEECIICNKIFPSIEEVRRHYEEVHVEKDLEIDIEKKLNEQDIKQKIPDIIGFKPEFEIALERITSINELEEQLEDKILDITEPIELLSKRNFIEMCKKIFEKYPFFVLDHFLFDWINGSTNEEIINKYHFYYSQEIWNVTKNILGFEEKRFIKKFPNEKLFQRNLQIVEWNEKYQELINNYLFFREILHNNIIKNLMRSWIVYSLINSQKFPMNEYENQILNKESLYAYSEIILPQNSNDILKRISEMKSEYLKKKFKEILNELYMNNLIQKNNDEIYGIINTQKIEKSILLNLKSNLGFLTRKRLVDALRFEFPGIQLLKEKLIIEGIISELEIRHQIITSKNRDSLDIYLKDAYEKRFENLSKIKSNNLRFYGREISSEIFIDELYELEKGEIDDHDDQVTRIAGLILAESIKIIPPQKTLKEYDFKIDLGDYEFRPEQNEAMEELRFEKKSKIFHCYVSIFEEVSYEKYLQLKSKIPFDEQGVIISFKTPSEKILADMITDKTIQFIDEKGLKLWVSITKRIPSRKNSVCKIYAEPISQIRNKMCIINSINYEDASANVTIVPELEEKIVTIHMLEEVPVFENNPKEFITKSQEYYEFIKLLSKLSSSDNFSDGIFNISANKDKINIEGYNEFTFDRYKWSIDFSKRSIERNFSCNCYFWQVNSQELCPHMVWAMNHLYQNFATFNPIWRIKIINLLNKFLRNNIQITLNNMEITKEKCKENKNLKNLLKELFSRSVR